MKTTSKEMGILLTDQFIQENPVQVIVKRRPKVVTSAGGFRRGDPVPLAPQTFRKVEINLRTALSARTTEDGAVVVPSFMLVTPWNADIKNHDRMVIDDKDCEIVTVGFASLLMRKTAEVYQHG